MIIGDVSAYIKQKGSGILDVPQIHLWVGISVWLNFLNQWYLFTVLTTSHSTIARIMRKQNISIRRFL